MQLDISIETYLLKSEFLKGFSTAALAVVFIQTGALLMKTQLLILYKG